MALFPKIQSPCPYKGDLGDILDGDVCRLCKREVFDLTAMSEAERIALIAGCKDEICVRYSFPVRPLAAAVVAAAVAGVPTAAAACSDAVETVYITGGGINDPANVQYVQVPEDKSVPMLPVVYEPKAPQPKS
jgi:hypothetical protein